MNEKTKAIVKAACELARVNDEDPDIREEAIEKVVKAVQDGLVECAEAMLP